MPDARALQHVTGVRGAEPAILELLRLAEDLLPREPGRAWGMALLARRLSREIEGDPLEGRCLAVLGKAHQWLGRFQQAEEALQRARELLAGEESVQAALCRTYLADIWRMRGRFREAEAALLQAADELAARGHDHGVRRCQRLLMRLYVDMDRDEEALRLDSRLRRTFANASDGLGLARCDWVMGVLAFKRNRYGRARRLLARAGEGLLAHGREVEAAWCGIDLAWAHDYANAYRAAARVLEESRVNLARLGMALDLAHADRVLGMLRWRNGQFEEALQALDRARATFARQKVHLEAARCLNNEGLVRTSIGDGPGARDAYAAALRRYRRLGWRVGAARCELNLGRLLLQEGEEDPGLRHLDQARKVFATQGMDLSVATVDRYRAAAWVRNGRRLKEAAELLEAGEEVFAKAGLQVDAALTRLERAEASRRRGERKQASALLRRVGRILPLAVPEEAWRVPLLRARLARDAGRRRRALRFYLRAVDAAQSLRATLRLQEHAGALYSRHRPLYEESVFLALELDEPEVALRVMEAARAQILSGLLAGPLSGIDPGLLKDEQRVSRRIEALRRRVAWWDAGNEHDAVVVRRAVRDLWRLARQQELLLTQLQPSGDPATADLVDLECLRARAGRAFPSGWTVLGYFVGSDRLAMLQLSEDGLTGRVRSLTDYDRLMLAQCTASEGGGWRHIYHYDSGSLSGTARHCLQWVHGLLLPPETLARLGPHHHLVMVPSGPLQHLPFHALWTKDGGYLAERAIVSYVPSVKVLQQLLQRSEGLTSPEDGALVLGVETPAGHPSRLPHALREAGHVFDALGSKGRLLSGDEASLSRLEEMARDGDLERYRWVHVASHARLWEGLGWQAGIALSDGYLRPARLQHLPLRARLVTLSGCQTARSQEVPGDELVGLPHAVLAAGAHALLATLWPVADDAAAEVMARLYARIRSGDGPGLALAMVQRELIRSGESPEVWAPYVLLGLP